MRAGATAESAKRSSTKSNEPRQLLPLPPLDDRSDKSQSGLGENSGGAASFASGGSSST